MGEPRRGGSGGRSGRRDRGDRDMKGAVPVVYEYDDDDGAARATPCDLVGPGTSH